MQVGIAYSENVQQVWLTIEVPDDATVNDVIARSGILGMFPHIDLATQKVGIFGKIVKPDASLRAGDRVEIYRPITCDPQTVARRDGVGGGEDD
jgi:putative ubiquitin-RnfH superfamily antitoxin RatB of RatAB toxin-antitoxin module